jgi:hypothetical protein
MYVLTYNWQELYQKTEYDAAVLYSDNLQLLELSLGHSSLLQFLHISSIPSFRNRIHTVRFLSPSDSDYVAQRGYETCFGRKRDDRTALHVVVDILSDCIRQLKTAKMWQRIEIVSEDGHDLVIRALLLALVPRRVLYLNVDVNRLTNMAYGSLSDTPQAYAPYVKGLQVRAPMVDDYEKRIEKEDGNPLGVHIKDFRPTTTEVAQFIASFINVESLRIQGCRDSPMLRICHGCDDLFAKNFGPTLYPNLSQLTLRNLYISGSRLRRFIKRHSGTMIHVDMKYVTLTDGSWRSIAQGLAKLPNLRELSLESIQQKGNSKAVTLPAQYNNHYCVKLEDRGQVQNFFKIFLEFFSTVQRLNPSRFRESRPMYHDVRLFTSFAQRKLGTIEGRSKCRHTWW